ncbi:MAG: hypothetical protein ACE5RC_07260, partial [Nitrosopumilus sp.]
VAKKIYFPLRNYDNITNNSIKFYPHKREYIQSFQEFILRHRTSIKEIDAINLLKKIAVTEHDD